MAFANRSAALFHLNKFDDCIADINEALARKYTLERQYILFGRKIQCLRTKGLLLEAKTEAQRAITFLNENISDDSLKEMMVKFVNTSLEKQIRSQDKPKEPKRVLNLTLKNRGDKIKSAHAALRIDKSEKKGRFVIADANIEPSEILFAEDAFASWLKPNLCNDFCFHCLASIKGRRFLPCQTCCQARFCSESCAKSAMSAYHAFECEFMGALQILSVGHLALRLVLTAGLKNVASAIATDGKEKVSSDYAAIWSLVDNVEHYDPERLSAITAAVAFLVTLVRGALGKLAAPENVFTEDVAGVLLKHVLQINCNAIGIQFDRDESFLGHQTLGNGLQVIGMGVYPTVSLLNHSCEKVVYTLFTGRAICVKSSNGFRAGDEITLCYGPHSRKLSTKDRRDVLKKSYFFDCDCKSCTSGKENVGLAFACPKCAGALVINYSDDTNGCVSCKNTVSDVSPLIEKLNEIKSALGLIWNVVEEGRYAEAEGRLHQVLANYSRYLYSKSDIICEIKEKLAYVCEEQKKLRDAMKAWLDCYYITKELEGEDTYEALFYLLKITSGLIEEADSFLDNPEKVVANLAKAKKYFARAMVVSKRLEGKEVRVLEARSYLLEQMPEPTVVAKDLETLTNYCLLYRKATASS